jgi:hypothetical protein
MNSDLVWQLNLDSTAENSAGLTRRGIDIERNEERRLDTGGK